MHTEHTYASEDSGACDAESETKRAHKSQQTSIMAHQNMVRLNCTESTLADKVRIQGSYISKGMHLWAEWTMTPWKL